MDSNKYDYGKAATALGTKSVSDQNSNKLLRLPGQAAAKNGFFFPRR